METRILNDLTVVGSVIFAKNETELPANPREGEIVLMDGRHYAYTRLASNYYSWMPISVKQSSHIHTQGVSSSTWIIAHNLGTTHYGIFIYDDQHNVVMANHNPINENTVVVNLASAMQGSAVIFAVTNFGATNFAATQLDIGNTTLTGNGTELMVNGSTVLTVDSGIPTASTTTLGGVKVDGTSITILDGVISSSAAVASTDDVGEGTSNLYFTEDRVNSLINEFASTGTVYSADKLSTPRTISLTGAVSGSAAFDGTGNISIETSGGSMSGGSSLNSIVGQFVGAVTPTIGVQQYYPRSAITISNIFANLSAPSTVNVVVGVKVNGVQQSTLTISAGQLTAESPVSISVGAGQYVTIDVISGVGNNLSVRLDY